MLNKLMRMNILAGSETGVDPVKNVGCDKGMDKKRKRKYIYPQLMFLSPITITGGAD